jgi:hypothetical protein
VEVNPVYRPHAHARVEDKPEVAPPTSTLAALEALAARVAGLTLSRTDPEAFFAEEFTVAAELRRLARLLGRAA